MEALFSFSILSRYLITGPHLPLFSFRYEDPVALDGGEEGMDTGCPHPGPGSSAALKDSGYGGSAPGSDLCSLLPADVYWACFAVTLPAPATQKCRSSLPN